MDFPALQKAARDGRVFLVHVHWNRNQTYPDVAGLAVLSEEDAAVATEKQKRDAAALSVICETTRAEVRTRSYLPDLKRTAIYARRVKKFISPALFTLDATDYSNDLSKTLSESNYNAARRGED